jgi:pimeloyl-ACP methyl ester carboxylesterase
VRDVISGIGKTVVLVGHSYGGIVITEAAAHNSAVIGLVDVAGFAADHRESAFQLSTTFPGSTFADALVAYPVSSGGKDFAISQEAFHRQVAADVPAAQAAVMGQRIARSPKPPCSKACHRRPGVATRPRGSPSATPARS